MTETMVRIKELVRTIPDFPKPGIQFRDITTLLKDPWGLRQTIDAMSQYFRDRPVDKIIAVESRGFILGGALAHQLHCGLVIARKRGKLPGPVEEIEYELEYGTDCIAIHKDAINPGDRCLLIDDLLATGGTADATCRLVERMGGTIVGCGFIINLPDIKGHERLARYDLHWLIDFEGH